MNIETKFNVKDKVWFMEDNKPVVETIWNIEISLGDNSPKVKYIFFHKKSNDNHRYFLEEEIFATKEELLKSL